MAQISEGEFNFPPIQSVIFGRGSVSRLGDKVDGLGAKRALVVTVPPVTRDTDLLNRVKSALGARYAGVYDGVIQHVPRECVTEGALVARDVGADILISLGGSSTADAAKGINLVLTAGEGVATFLDKFDSLEAVPPSQYDRIKLSQIAVPTTLSGGEFTPIAGITNTKRKVKEGIHNAALTPKVIILDPEATTFTPDDLWIATGMKILSDAFSKTCAPLPMPFAEAMQLHTIRLINQNLMLSTRNPCNLEPRALLLHSVWLSMYGNTPMGMGIIGALRHQIGGGYGVSHGVASTIVFPYCVEFYHHLIDERLISIARALDLPVGDATSTASAVIGRVRELARETGLPTRLRDVGIPENVLGDIAKASLKDFFAGSSLKPVSEAQFLDILRKAW